MNDEILNLTKELKEELYQSELFKQYFLLKKQIENNNELFNLRTKMKKAAKNCDQKDIFMQLQQEYYNHPLMVNFKQIEDQVWDELAMLKNIINN